MEQTHEKWVYLEMKRVKNIQIKEQKLAVRKKGSHGM